MKTSRRTGFTLTDMCVVLALVALLLALLSRVPSGSREQGDRILCANTLRAIGLAIAGYANENKGQFPRTFFDETPNPVATEYTGWQSANPFLRGGPDANDVTAALFLVLRTQDITSKVFVCPSSLATPWNFNNLGPRGVSNFPGRAHLSYSYQNPYPTQAALAKGFKLNLNLTSDFALGSDMNPGGPAVTTVAPNSSRQQMRTANSPNHNGDGQNVLYADSHVEFNTTVFCGSPRPTPGAPRDNVFTYEAAAGVPAGTRGGSTDQYDSVLLPTALDGLQPPAAARMPWAWFLIPAAMLGLLALVVVGVIIFVRGGKSAAPAGPPYDAGSVR